MKNKIARRDTFCWALWVELSPIREILRKDCFNNCWIQFQNLSYWWLELNFGKYFELIFCCKILNKVYLTMFNGFLHSFKNNWIWNCDDDGRNKEWNDKESFDVSLKMSFLYIIKIKQKYIILYYTCVHNYFPRARVNMKNM